MEVEYLLTADDLYAFQWRAAYGSAKSRRARRKVYLYLFLTLLLIAVLPAIGGDGFVLNRVSWFFLATTFPLISVLYWQIEKRMLHRAIHELVKQEKPDKGQLGKHKIVLTETGVRETTAVGDSHTAWAGVDRIEENADYIFIYTTPGAAHLVPKRAFGGSEAERFYRLAKDSKARTEG